MLVHLAWYGSCACSIVMVMSGAPRGPLGPVLLDLAAPMTGADRWSALPKSHAGRAQLYGQPQGVSLHCMHMHGMPCYMRPVVAMLLSIMRKLYNWYSSSSFSIQQYYTQLQAVPVRLAMTCSMKAQSAETSLNPSISSAKCPPGLATSRTGAVPC